MYPHYSYLYWNRKSTTVEESTGLYRSSLINTRMTSSTCPTDVLGADLIVDDDSLETFTLEPDIAIYHTGMCQDSRATIGVIFRSLNLEISVCINEYEPTLGENQTAQSLDSFSEIVLVPEPCSEEFIPNPGCRIIIYNSSDEPFHFFQSPVTPVGIPLITRVYRSIKQPLPGGCGWVCLPVQYMLSGFYPEGKKARLTLIMFSQVKSLIHEI